MRARLWALLGFGLASCLLVWPMIGVAHLPLADLPNHIARLHIAAALAEDPATPLSAYYSYALGLSPNMAVDLVWAAFGHPLGAEGFANLMMMFYGINLVAAAMILHRVVWKSWSAWPAAVGLFAYNLPFYWGFQNFVFTVPFAIHALSFWLACEGWPVARRLCVAIPVALALFFMHLFAFAIFALAAFGREMQRLWGARANGFGAALGRTLVLAVPFLIPAAILAYRIVASPPNPAGTTTRATDLLEKLQVLSSPFGWPGALAPWEPHRAAIALGVGCLIAFVVLLRKREGARLSLSVPMIGPLIVIGLLAVFAPSWTNGVALVHIRYLAVFLILLLAATQWQGMGRRGALMLCLVLSLIGLARGVQLNTLARSYSADIDDLQALSAEVIPAGQRAIVMVSDALFDEVLNWHDAAHIVTAADAFVPTLFQGVHALRLHPKWVSHGIAAGRPPSAELLFDAHWQPHPADHPAPEVFLQDWTAKYDFLMAKDMDKTTLSQSPALQFVAERGRYGVYRISP